jgi:hypothetical protein
MLASAWQIYQKVSPEGLGVRTLRQRYFRQFAKRSSTRQMFPNFGRPEIFELYVGENSVPE